MSRNFNILVGGTYRKKIFNPFHWLRAEFLVTKLKSQFYYFKNFSKDSEWMEEMLNYSHYNKTCQKV